MFDRNKTSQINFEDFTALWKYVVEWQNCFKKFDHDKSGFIDSLEFKQALHTFGRLKFKDLIFT